MVIEAADESGIYIPRFCYHKKLSIAANCRMCLVEVEKAAKALPACATPVTDGMKVHTRSPKAINAQKGVMEFLLINHPLDCPICDQGGECELQDLAVSFGKDDSRYYENKRVVSQKNLGPLIATDMTRCIHCTRCVRFGEEVSGVREMGGTGRGEHTEIGTYIETTIDSEMSGNVIDLCPVGALTSKPFRFSARPWEMSQASTIAAHDCIGSNLNVHIRNGKVMRVVPKDNEEVNECWISDRDRFSYEGLNSDDRLLKPMTRVGSSWQQTGWSEGLDQAVSGIRKVLDRHGAGEVGCLISPNATVEEQFLAQKLLRGIGSANIDHRLRQQDFTDQDGAPLFPWLGQSLQDIEQLNAALLIGSNIRKDQPIAAHRLRKAVLNDAHIMCVNPVDYAFHFKLTEKLITAPQNMVKSLAGVANALLQKAGQTAPQALEGLLANVSVGATHQAIADQLVSARNSAIFMGNYAAGHHEFASLRALAGLIAKLSNSALSYLSDGCNSAGAWLTGAVPHRVAGGKPAAHSGMNIREMIRQPLKAYILVGIEPDLDSIFGDQLLAALKGAEYVIALSAYRSASLESCARVLLPITPHIETSGTFVNAEGRWQSFAGVVPPRGEARPAWKVLRVMGNLFDVAGFEYVTSEEVLLEAQGEIGEVVPDNSIPYQVSSNPASSGDGLVRIADVPIYAVDAAVRRARSLQKTSDAAIDAVHINSSVAGRLGVTGTAQVAVRQNGTQIVLPLVIDERIPDDGVLLHGAFPQAIGFSADYSPISIQKA